MFSSICALLVASALGQAPEAAWLKSIPADVDVVVHCRGIDATEKDLMAMLQAMSPNLANQVEAPLKQSVEAGKRRFGLVNAGSPVLAAVEFPATASGKSPSALIFVRSDDYQATLESLAGPAGKPEPQAQDLGIDKIVDGDGVSIFVKKADGFVAFAPGDDTLIVSMARGLDSSLQDRLSPEIRDQLLSGDLGAYANLADLQKKYTNEIQAIREQMTAVLQQAGNQGRPGQAQRVTSFYDSLFDTVQQGDSLALHLDFDASGLTLSGLLRPVEDSKAAQNLKTARTGDASLLGKLPRGMLGYFYMNIDPQTIENLQSMNFSELDPDFKNQPEYKAAIETIRQVGHQESFSAMNILGGLEGITVARPEHPEKVESGTRQMLKAMKSSAFVKDVEVEPNAQNYKGISFTRSATTMDLDKLVARQGGNPGAEAMMRSMFADGRLVSWTGVGDGLTYSVIAPSWDDAKKKLDVVTSNEGGIGQTKGFKTLREQLPDSLSVLVLVQAQSAVRAATRFVSSMAGDNANLQPPADLPDAPTFLGGSLLVSPSGYRFDFVVPSANGPVFETGFTPLIQAAQGRVNQ